MPIPHSPFRLDGRVAWITGSSRGLGRVIAETLAASGAKTVVNCYNNTARGEEVVQSIQDKGGEAMLVSGDATDADAIDRMADEIESSFGAVDILVVNATPDQPMKTLGDYSWDEYQAMLDAFVKSPFLLAQRVTPTMKERGYGRLINITSEVFHVGMPEFSAYVAAKGGQTGWGRSVSNELAPYGITVNSVAPGWVPVERHEDVPQADKDAYLTTVPAKRWGKPADVAYAVNYFAAEEAGFLTGQTLAVNGGRTLL